MKITVDTNVLLRLVLGDDEPQKRLAFEAIRTADLVAISLHSLCELVWVLARSYDVPRPDMAEAVRALTSIGNVIVNRPAVAAGLAMLDAGGDFADGVIAYDGAWLGGDTFVSFDRKAVRLLKDAGIAAQVLG